MSCKQEVISVENYTKLVSIWHLALKSDFFAMNLHNYFSNAEFTRVHEHDKDYCVRPGSPKHFHFHSNQCIFLSKIIKSSEISSLQKSKNVVIHKSKFFHKFQTHLHFKVAIHFVLPYIWRAHKTDINKSQRQKFLIFQTPVYNTGFLSNIWSLKRNLRPWWHQYDIMRVIFSDVTKLRTQDIIQLFSQSESLSTWWVDWP